MLLERESAIIAAGLLSLVMQGSLRNMVGENTSSRVKSLLRVGISVHSPHPPYSRLSKVLSNVKGKGYKSSGQVAWQKVASVQRSFLSGAFSIFKAKSPR